MVNIPTERTGRAAKYTAPDSTDDRGWDMASLIQLKAWQRIETEGRKINRKLGKPRDYKNKYWQVK